MIKSQRIDLRVDEEEKDLLVTDAMARKKSVSEHIRDIEAFTDVHTLYYAERIYNGSYETRIFWTAQTRDKWIRDDQRENNSYFKEWEVEL